MHRPRRFLPLLVCVSLASSTTTLLHVAFAEPSAAELTAAREMFDDGLKLEEKSRWAEALEKFRKVAAIKTTAAVRFHLALCLENTDHLVDALDEFERAQADAQSDPKGATVATNAAKHIDQLRERIPRVIVKVPEGATVTSLTVDGKEISTGILGSAMPIDPGKHTIVVKAQGKATFTKEVDLSEKSKPLTIEAKLVDEGTPTPPEETVKSEPATPKDESASGSSSKGSALPWIVGGVGVAALGGAAFMFVKRNGTISDLDSACGPDRNHCPSSAKDTADSGKTYTTVGNILAGVGIVAIGTAVVLLLTQGGSSSAESPPPATAKKPSGPTWTLGASPAPLGIGVAAAF